MRLSDPIDHLGKLRGSLLHKPVTGWELYLGSLYFEAALHYVVERIRPTIFLKGVYLLLQVVLWRFSG